ncbi:MAG: GNAT family N-acetyltransferase [Boseongicola sp.]|nr:MAG: GNAT family N-acetyltransferase [Boseongicola sp.]
MLKIKLSDDMTACLGIRHEVFVVEQCIAKEDEVDGMDPAATHLLAEQDGLAVGTARMLIDGPTGKIGRVAVLKSHRGQGIGKALIEAAVAYLETIPTLKHAKLGAQTSALNFYCDLGFKPVGDIFDDVGIPHQEMARRL